MDILTLLEELQTIARNGLHFANNPYDQERYERLLEITAEHYQTTLNLPANEVKGRFADELGVITPKVGGDAAVFDDEGRILLQLRSDNHKWCLPCGWVDPNESPMACAVREAKEETGLYVRVLELIDVYYRPADVGYGPHSVVSICYLCEVVGGELQKSHEGLDVRFWKIADVPVWHSHHRRFADLAYARWQAR